MMNNFHIIIPARLESTRLKNKVLLEINGKSIVQLVYEKAQSINPLSVTVATNHKDIFDHIKSLGGEVLMTSSDHQSGMDRVNEAASLLQISDDETILNLQGDEPLMPENIMIETGNSIRSNINIATAACVLSDKNEITDPNNVKVVTTNNNYAHYFSRSLIPHSNEVSNITYYQHLGIYSYNRCILKELANLDVTYLEKTERLEQLRFLDHGYKIYVNKYDQPAPIGIDTDKDYKKTLSVLSKK